MKRIFITTMIIIICLVCFVGCNSENDKNKNMTKYSIVLTEENYQDYLTIETSLFFYPSSYRIDYHYIRGALSYAYYDNVIITYDYIPMNSDPSTKTLKLNLGGCATITTNGGSRYEITKVTGTVTYWI